MGDFHDLGHIRYIKRKFRKPLNRFTGETHRMGIPTLTSTTGEESESNAE
jgi:hypothetical protein